MKPQDAMLLKQNFVPVRIAAKLSGFAVSTLHRAADDERIKATRVARNLYIEWDDLRRYVGDTMAAMLPRTAAAAMKTAGGDA